MRRLALAITLACVLSGMARAGEIPTTGAVAPPTPSTVSVTGEIHPTGATTPGEIHTTGGTAPGEMPGTGATAPGEIPSTGGLLTIILTFIGLVP